MIKRYISLNNLHLSTTVTVDNQEKTIIFKGGKLLPNRVNGTFITDNGDLQKAIESDNGYGKTFIELKSENEVSKVEDQKKNQNSYDIIDMVVTVQQAIEWVRHNLSIELKKNSTIREIIKVVNQHGFDFPKLKQRESSRHDKK